MDHRDKRAQVPGDNPPTITITDLLNQHSYTVAQTERGYRLQLSLNGRTILADISQDADIIATAEELVGQLEASKAT